MITLSYLQFILYWLVLFVLSVWGCYHRFWHLKFKKQLFFAMGWIRKNYSAKDAAETAQAEPAPQPKTQS